MDADAAILDAIRRPTRYTVHIDGPWCITFEFDGQDAARVEFEQYH
jgi:proteic killer suppression protein